MGRKPCARSYLWKSPQSQAAERLVAGSLDVDLEVPPHGCFPWWRWGFPYGSLSPYQGRLLFPAKQLQQCKQAGALGLSMDSA